MARTKRPLVDVCCVLLLAASAAARGASGVSAEVDTVHAQLFAPDREKTIRAAVAAEVIGLRELLPAK